MDTEQLFKNCWKKSQKEIAELVKKFVDEEFFVTFPELKGNVAILINGSVGRGTYDKESDIDFAVIFHKDNDWKEKKFVLLGEFKGENLVSKIKPLELHGGNILSLQKLESDLGSWNDDWLLSQISDSIIVYDPGNEIRAVKEKYNWYPEDVCREKINSSFAEASWMIFDRYQAGYKRKNLYYTELTKLKILRLFMFCLLLANKKYPMSDKHLIVDVKSLSGEHAKLVKQIETIIKSRSMKRNYGKLIQLRSKIEKILLDRGLIENKEIVYWVGLRPTRKVEI